MPITATVSVKNIGTDEGSGTYTVSVLPENSTSVDFNFLYEKEYANVTDYIFDAKSTKYNLKTTKISYSNPYYFNTLSASSKVSAYRVDNRKTVGISSKDLFKALYPTASKLNKYFTGDGWKDTTLANCVGYAHGRIIELQALAVKYEFVKEIDGVWKVTSSNKVIAAPSDGVTKNNIPVCDAKQQYTYAGRGYGGGWRTDLDGFYISTVNPKPGCAIVWGNANDDSCGHIAVVEKVLDEGTANESVIISESAYSKYGVKTIIYYERVYKKKNWSLNGDTFMGFLFSPVSQLLETSSAGTITTINTIQPTAEQLAALEVAKNAINADVIYDAIPKGSEVEIMQFGSKNSNSDETKYRINKIGAIGVVEEVTDDKFPYKVTSDNNLIGYFMRDAIELVQDTV